MLPETDPRRHTEFRGLAKSGIVVDTNKVTISTIVIRNLSVVCVNAVSASRRHVCQEYYEALAVSNSHSPMLDIGYYVLQTSE